MGSGIVAGSSQLLKGGELLSPLLIALGCALLLSLISQFLLVAGFVARLRRWQRPLLDDDHCPKALVILCLRGGDPFLSKCIAELLRQDYPDYQICFVVDRIDDPAMAILQASIVDVSADRFRVELLEQPLRSCSLKCSSLVQSLRSMPASTKFIAQIDADTIPHQSWLRELATGLAPESVGAATGNRWYMPEHRSSGALVRHIWNAAAVVQMYWYSIAWGGTLAIKVDSIQRAGLVERWQNAFCEDTMLKHQLGVIGQRVAFVPSLIMINREDCSLSGFNHWVKRQLMTARLYHPSWLAVMGHGVSSALLLLWGWGSSLALLLVGDWTWACCVAAAMIAFQFCLMSMLPWMERSVAAIVASRGQSTDWNKDFGWLEYFGAVWKTQAVYTWALIASQFLRRVEWRGIQYNINGPWQVEMTGYTPYNESQCDENANRSL